MVTASSTRKLLFLIFYIITVLYNKWDGVVEGYKLLHTTSPLLSSFRYDNQHIRFQHRFIVVRDISLMEKKSSIVMMARGFGSIANNSYNNATGPHDNRKDVNSNTTSPPPPTDAATTTMESDLAIFGRKVVRPSLGVKGKSCVEKFLMMYTCKICNGRNSQMVMILVLIFLFSLIHIFVSIFNRYLKLLIHKEW